MYKTWEELGLADNYIFQKVMLNEELCKRILSEIIGKEVIKIDYTTYEKAIEFEEGYYKYVFTNNSYNNSNKHIELQDGTITIFLNSKGTKGEISSDLKEFLKCVEGVFTGGNFSAILEKEIRCIKDSKKWRKRIYVHGAAVKR